jgi:TRAP-type C4-dicarboxylate transport system substrate-binding protein
MEYSLSIGSILLAVSSSANSKITLNANSWTPLTHPLTTTLVSWCEDVKKVTAARVKCNLLPKPVVAAGQTFEALKDGLADVSFIVHGFTPGRFPLAEFKEFPFLGASVAPAEVLPFLELWAEAYGQSRCGEASAVAT